MLISFCTDSKTHRRQVCCVYSCTHSTFHQQAALQHHQTVGALVLDMKTLCPAFIPCLAFEPIACAVQYLGNAVSTRSQYLGSATSQTAFACMPALCDFSHAHLHTQGIGNLVLRTQVRLGVTNVISHEANSSLEHLGFTTKPH